jgi:6-phosphofructokinase 1
MPFEYEKLAAEIDRRHREGSKSTLVVVAEGASPKDGKQTSQQTTAGDRRLGGISEFVAKEIGERTGKEVRICVLGHLQRGGAPTTLDRILATGFGVKAVELIAEGKFGSMVSYQNCTFIDVPISSAVQRMRRVNPDSQLVNIARSVGISFGN